MMPLNYLASKHRSCRKDSGDRGGWSEGKGSAMKLKRPFLVIVGQPGQHFNTKNRICGGAQSLWFQR